MTTPTPAPPLLTRAQRSVLLAHPLAGVRAVAGLLEGVLLVPAASSSGGSGGSAGAPVAVPLHPHAAPPAATAPFGVLSAVGQPVVFAPPLGADVTARVEVQLLLTATSLAQVADLLAQASAAVTGRGQGGVWLTGVREDGSPQALPGPASSAGGLVVPTWLAVLDRAPAGGQEPLVAGGLAQAVARWELELAVVEAADAT